ncbi:hypothetical protein FG297_22835 [Vibrio alginolyticus]|nr:hypothetical protein [Vibrio alginolyticus]EHA1137212.1 hypothetical protein [Vibrio alginolyticus]
MSLRTMPVPRTAKRLHKSDTQTESKPHLAQRNSPQTLSNMNLATSVSPLEHESSPKNDSSNALILLHILTKTLRSKCMFLLRLRSKCV